MSQRRECDYGNRYRCDVRSTLKSDRLYSLKPNMEKLYTVSTNKTGS